MLCCREQGPPGSVYQLYAFKLPNCEIILYFTTGDPLLHSVLTVLSSFSRLSVMQQVWTSKHVDQFIYRFVRFKILFAHFKWGNRAEDAEEDKNGNISDRHFLMPADQSLPTIEFWTPATFRTVNLYIRYGTVTSPDKRPLHRHANFAKWFFVIIFIHKSNRSWWFIQARRYFELVCMKISVNTAEQRA